MPEFSGTIEECTEYARQKPTRVATCEVVHPTGAREVLDVQAR